MAVAMNDDVLPSKRAMTPPSLTRIVLQVLSIIAGVAFGLWALYRIGFIVFMLIVAALFAYVIAPLVQLAERPIRIVSRPRRLSRGGAIVVVYVLMAGGVSAGAALLLPTATQQVSDLISRAPAYAQSILSWEGGWSRYYERLPIPLELRRTIDQSVRSAGDAAIGSARGSFLALMSAVGADLPWLVLIPILAFFLLKDATNFRRTIVTALPQTIRLRADRLFNELNATLAAFVRAQLLACLLVGSLCGLGFAVLRIPYPLVLGVLAGALEFIPLVGPLLLAIFASIIAALHAPIEVLWVIGLLGTLRVVEDYVIYPRLIGRGIQLHPLAVIVAVLIGAELGGVAGMFLAVPTVAIASVIFRHWREWRDDNSSHAPAQTPI
jgi:predicted PurR-regulated permease PerM